MCATRVGRLSFTEYLAALDPNAERVELEELREEVVELRAERNALVRAQQAVANAVYRLDRALKDAERPRCAVCGRVYADFGWRRTTGCARKGRWACTRGEA